VQSLLGECGGTCVSSFGAYIDAVIHGRRAEYALLRGQIERESACDEYIGAEWQVRPMLFEGAYGNNEPRVLREVRGDIDPA
jgi:hypothetical protein